jgi:hypothetical protein
MWGGDVNANGNSRYNGPANDRSVIFNVIANAVVPGYLNVDVNMNAIARYNGPANDRSSIFNFVGNNVIVTHVP